MALKKIHSSKHYYIIQKQDKYFTFDETQKTSLHIHRRSAHDWTRIGVNFRGKRRKKFVENRRIVRLVGLFSDDAHQRNGESFQ